VSAAIDLKMGKATRDAFGEALRDFGKADKRIVVVDGDVNNSTRTEWFGKEAPERFFNLGIAESNMIGVAAGLAACGKVPFVASCDFPLGERIRPDPDVRRVPTRQRQAGRQPRWYLDR